MNRLMTMRLGFLPALLLTFAFLQGCASVNPIAAADTLELRAYAASGTYNIFQAKGLALIRGGTLPDDVSLRLISAEERATPVVDSLDETLEEFELIKDAVAAGTTGEEQFVIVSNSLNGWLTRASPLIDNLVNAVKGAE